MQCVKYRRSNRSKRTEEDVKNVGILLLTHAFIFCSGYVFLELDVSIEDLTHFKLENINTFIWSQIIASLVVSISE